MAEIKRRSADKYYNASESGSELARFRNEQSKTHRKFTEASQHPLKNAYPLCHYTLRSGTSRLTSQFA
jgi:hypothetical protein